MPNWLLSIRRIKAFSELAISQSVVTSLDWTTIKEALVYCHVPTYIGRVLDDYLHNKYIEYSSRCAIDRRTNYIPAEIGAGILIVEHKAYDFPCFPAGQCNDLLLRRRYARLRRLQKCREDHPPTETRCGTSEYRGNISVIESKISEMNHIRNNSKQNVKVLDVYQNFQPEKAAIT